MYNLVRGVSEGLSSAGFGAAAVPRMTAGMTQAGRVAGAAIESSPYARQIKTGLEHATQAADGYFGPPALSTLPNAVGSAVGLGNQVYEMNKKRNK